jgi:hypothetical protein
VIQESQIGLGIGDKKLHTTREGLYTPPINSPAWQITARVHISRRQAVVERRQVLRAAGTGKCKTNRGSRTSDGSVRTSCIFRAWCSPVHRCKALGELFTVAWRSDYELRGRVQAKIEFDVRLSIDRPGGLACSAWRLVDVCRWPPHPKTALEAAETSPYVISHYFVWQREGPERLCARPRSALFLWASILERGPRNASWSKVAGYRTREHQPRGGLHGSWRGAGGGL